MKNKGILYIFLLLWLIVSYNSQFADASMPLIGFGINIVLSAVLLLVMLPTLLDFHFNNYQKWLLIILVYWGASVTWSINSEAFGAYYKFVIPYILCFFLSANIGGKKEVETVMKLELIAVFLCAIFVLFVVNTGDLSEERLGGADEDRVWNANDIGLKMAVGYAICVYFLLKGNISKALLLIFILVLLLVGLMSGSRKVIILLILFTALLMIIRAKKNRKILYISYSLMFVALSFYAVMSIPVLYDVLGKRIDMLFDGLRGDSGGYSMDERSLMIGYGIEFFLESPWTGRGFNAFSELFGQITGWYVYSHNNFIELLVNTGIVGLILYYSLIIYILKGLWKPAFRGKDTLAQVLILYTLITTILDYAMVSYVNIPTIFRLMYTARYCQIIKKNDLVIVKM